ncbi:MAG TPA: PQQ-dependent sugar dehydrogenase [Xanthomonadales bacterium]|nr:PQQ-dependent sugar dehydrogenase [Xanthomonadales bacterium]
MRLSSLCLALVFAVPPAAIAGQAIQDSPAKKPFNAQEVAKFDEPWAMAFLADGRLLVTEKAGRLKLLGVDGKVGTISGAPKVDYGGQGGFGDVALHPDFANNHLVYYSYVEAGDNDTRGAVVARAKLTLDAAGGGALSDPQVVWKQDPKVDGRGHYSHRIVFGKGKLWITSGERQHFDPAQDMKMNLGKVIRLNDDGSLPPDNPFADQGGVAAQVWTLGHRNILGLAFDRNGELWDLEMGPMGGDELNHIERGSNYGYPIVSNGDHYDGRVIPDHDTRPEFNAPELWWTPVISPGYLLFYDADAFPQWKGSALAAGLSSMAIVRIAFDGMDATEAERFDMGARIRSLAVSPNGELYALEDAPTGRLLKLVPRNPRNGKKPEEPAPEK